MRTLTIRTHLSGKQDQEYFQAILTLAGAVLKHDWVFVESDSADVVIVSYDSAEPYSAWDEYSDKYPLDRLVAYANEKPRAGVKWHIQRPSGAMPRLSEVVKVLNTIAEQLCTTSAQTPQARVNGKRSELASAPSLTEEQRGGLRFAPQRHLAGIIQRAVDSGECLVCSAPGHPPVYLSPKENAVYSAADLKSLSSLCRIDSGGIDARSLLDGEFNKKVCSRGAMKRRPLSEFLWFALLSGSNGRLIDGFDEHEAVYLKEWPGYVRLPFYGMYQDIAACMANGAGTLREIATHTASPIQNVIDFHNACEQMGLIARAGEARLLAEKKARHRGRMGSLLKPHFKNSLYLRLVIVGSVGSGKTTALTTLSESLPILTEVQPSDAVGMVKSTTTVAMEYGDIRVSDDAKLQIYGTPGQRRFDFMGQMLCANAWGLLILIDNTATAPLVDMDYYVDMYVKAMPNSRVAAGISHYDASTSPCIEDYKRLIRDKGYSFPVVAVDARDSESLVSLVAACAETPGY